MIQIVDVSSHNAPVNWAAVKAAGFAVAIAKASEGVNSPDSKMAKHCAGARAAGFWIGTYHYLRVRHCRPQDARQQMREYVAIWREQACALRPIIDVETAGNDLCAPDEWAQAVTDAVGELEAQTDVSPIIYTSPGEWLGAHLGGLSALRRCPLWLASYGSAAHAPAPWATFAAWQYTGSGTIAGAGPYDLSRAADLVPLLMPDV